MSEREGAGKPNDEPGLTIEELAERFGVSVRAIRFYIAQGLLPGPGSRGKGATYGEEHIVRLGLIRRLTERHMPLAKIQALLEGLSLDEARTLQVAEEGLATQLVEAERRQSPQGYVAALLDDARRARGLPLQSPAPDISVKPGAPADQAKHARVSPAPQAPADKDVSGAATPAPLAPGEIEAWYRWTLAPGIELQVSAQAQARFGALLRALLRVARQHEHNANDANNTNNTNDSGGS